MEEILKIINRNIKLTTAMHVGLDNNISNFICDYFWETTFVDSNCPWTWKTLPENDVCSHSIFSDESKFLEDLNYENPYYDFGYIHNRNSRDFQRYMFIYMVKNKFKVIMTHPSVPCFKPSFFQKITVRTNNDGDYKLYYLDFILEDFEEYFKSQK